jgi:hypothetical protein
MILPAKVFEAPTYFMVHKAYLVCEIFGKANKIPKIFVTFLWF